MSTDDPTLAETLYVAYKSQFDQPWGHLSPNDQEPWQRQAATLATTHRIEPLGGPDHKALHEEALSTINHLELQLAELREQLAGKK